MFAASSKNIILSIKSALLGMENTYLIILSVALLAAILSLIIVIVVTKHSNKTRAELRELDYLTKIYNRAYYYKKCRLFLDQTEGEYAIVAFDINKFKLINEYYGTNDADNLLMRISEKLITFYTNGQIKVFGRIESDKFSWIMTSDKNKIEKIFNSLDEIRNDYPHSISFNMGVYIIEDNKMDVEGAYSRANIASRSIKGNFDKFIQYFDSKMIKNLASEQYIINNIDDAIMTEEILVYFQPKYDLQGNRISGAEALVRWKNKEKGMISPGEFVPALENNGLITKLDKFIWERTARYLAEWRSKGLNPAPVSINISKVDLLEKDLPEYIEGIVRKYQIPHNLFQLEITESAYVDGSVDVTSILKSFKNKGFTILMDDFGSGYSSLNTLRQFPIDILKIDLKFLTGFDDSQEAQKGKLIIESIVAMAKQLNLGIVVEGTETPEQVEYCKNIGCEVAQGYYFSKPIPADDYIKMVLDDKKLMRNNMNNASLNNDTIWNKNAMTEDFFNNTNGSLGTFLFRRGKLEGFRLNDNYFNLIEQTRKDFFAIQRNLLDFVYPADLDFVLSKINECIKDKGIISFEYRRVNSNGNVKWIKCRLTYVHNNDDDKSINYFFASLDDVTVEHNLNDDIKNFLDNSEYAVIKCDLNTNEVLMHNNKLLKMLGLTEEEFDFNYKNDYRRLIVKRDLENLINSLPEENGATKRINISLKSKDGEISVVNICKIVERGNDRFSYFNFFRN